MHGDGCSVSCIVMASLILVEVLIVGGSARKVAHFGSWPSMER